MERKNAWETYDEKQQAEVFAFAEDYRQFLSKCKTERECVTELKARGYKIGVATSRTSASLEYYINEHDIADFIDVAVTMDDVTKHKPHSETVDKTIEKLSGTPEESIMIGDTKYDIGCAMNAGVDSVLVGWSHYVDIDGIREEGFVPTYIIDKPADLLDLI